METHGGGSQFDSANIQQILRTIVLALLCWLLPFSNPVLNVTLAAGLTELLLKLGNIDLGYFRRMVLPKVYSVPMDGYVGPALMRYIMDNFRSQMQNMRVDMRAGVLKFDRNDASETIKDAFDGCSITIAVSPGTSSFDMTVKGNGEREAVDVLRRYLVDILQRTSVSNRVNIYQLEVNGGGGGGRRKRRRDDDDDDRDGGDCSVEWHHTETTNTSSFRNTILTRKNEGELYDDFRRFLVNEELYGRRGWCWKRGYLLKGPPGSGKTTIIRALANELPNCGGIYIVDMSLLREKSNQSQILQQAFRKIAGLSQPHLVCMEDIDKALDRGSHNTRLIGTLINCIDGLVQNSGRVFVMTVNDDEWVKQKENQVLLREGRVDLIVSVEFCDSEQVCRVLDLNFPQYDHCNIVMDQKLRLRKDKLKMATLYNLIKKKIEHHDDLMRLLFVPERDDSDDDKMDDNTQVDEEDDDSKDGKKTKLRKDDEMLDTDWDYDGVSEDNSNNDRDDMTEEQLEAVDSVMYGHYFKLFRMKDGKEVLIPKMKQIMDLENCQTAMYNDEYRFHEPLVDLGEGKPELRDQGKSYRVIPYNDSTMNQMRNHYRCLIRLHYMQNCWNMARETQRHLYSNMLHLSQQLLMDQQFLRIDLEKRRQLVLAVQAVNPDLELDVPGPYWGTAEQQKETQNIVQVTEALKQEVGEEEEQEKIKEIMKSARKNEMLIGLREMMKKRDWDDACEDLVDHVGFMDGRDMCVNQVRIRKQSQEFPGMNCDHNVEKIMYNNGSD